MTTPLESAVTYVNEWAAKLYPTWEHRYNPTTIAEHNLGAMTLIGDMLAQGIRAKTIPDPAMFPVYEHQVAAEALDEWYRKALANGTVKNRETGFLDRGGKPGMGMLNDFPERVLVGMFAARSPEQIDLRTLLDLATSADDWQGAVAHLARAIEHVAFGKKC